MPAWMRIIVISVIALVVLVLIWGAMGYWSFKYLIRSTHEKITMPAAFTEFSGDSLTLVTRDNLKIAGWYFEPLPYDSTKSTVILLACLRGNRITLASRALFYLYQGYATLLIDLRSTGESEGDFTSFGWYEVNDLLAAIDYLKHKKKTRKIALHGLSAGAATICFALPKLNKIDFMVLESCYDKMSHAFKNRVRERFGLPPIFFYPIEYFAQQKFAGNFYKMNPIDYVSLIRCPVFLLSGEKEYRVQMHETQALYNRIKSPKKIWFVKGVQHVNFHHHKTAEYENQLNSFLAEVAHYQRSASR